MGVVLMSKRELKRIDVLARLDSRRLTTLAAADLMRVTVRQTHRLLKRYRDGGAPAIANRRRGRPSNNRLSDVVRDHAIGRVREYYADFGPTSAAEKLGERHDVRVSRETLRGWMRQGLVKARRRCQRHQQPSSVARCFLPRVLSGSWIASTDWMYSSIYSGGRPCSLPPARTKSLYQS